MTSLPPPLPPTLTEERAATAAVPVRRPLTPAGVLLRVFGGVLVAAFVVMGTWGTLDWLFRASDTATVPVTGSFTAVRVVIDSGDVRLSPGTAGDVQRTRHYGLVKPSFSVAVVDGTLVVKGRCAAVVFARCSVDVTVGVPPKVPVTVSSGSGDVHVFLLDGPVTVSSGAGDISVKGTVGSLDLDSGAGDIDVTEVDATAVRAHSGAGDVSLQFRSAPLTIDAESGAGDITVIVPADGATYRLDVDTGAGDERVDIASDPASEHRLRAHSGAGDVSVRHPR